MSDAYQCDRCGEYGEGSAPNTLEPTNSKDGLPVLGDGFIREKDLDLCSGCSRAFQSFMDGNR